MLPDSAKSPELEIAHVLFMDIVGYSLLSMDEQLRAVEELKELTRRTAEFRRAELASELICLSSGDGMALVFFRDPVASVRCAVEICRALQSRPHLKLRLGLHSGPVYRVRDINASHNVAGGGINFAQRVMECGDTGHVLLSSQVAELLSQLNDWAPWLHDLGECEVKHGVRLRLFNFYHRDIGNPSLPQKLRPRTPPSATAVATAGPAEPAPAPPTALRVALLYKRHAQPDEQVLKSLEHELVASGFQVFIDRHLAIGIEWAKEIERQVRTSDAVVPLLSAASMQSEMLAYEVEIAHDASQQQQGKPRLLPIRIGYTGPLPEQLSRILNPLQHALWESAKDDARVVSDLINALRNPPSLKTAEHRKKLEAVGGAVPLDSKFYVVRPTDDDFRSAIARQDSIILLKGARQMGKTSLLARGLQQAREAGAKVVLTDFQMFNAEHLESAQSLFLTMAEWIAMQLDLDVLPQDAWNPKSGANINFQRFLRREVLGKLTTPLVWGLDEVDRLFSCSFGSEVFGLFRSWHNARSLDPTGPWTRLTMAIAYATEAHLFITDVNQSPFNVGTRINLDDFTLEQVADLNQRHGAPLRDQAELEKFYQLVSGQPYLVRRGLHELVARGLRLAAFEAQADRDEGIFGDHLRRILVLLAKDHELYEVVRAVLQGHPCPTSESFYRLRTAGVMAGDSAHDARPRCLLYKSYLKRHLL